MAEDKNKKKKEKTYKQPSYSNPIWNHNKPPKKMANKAQVGAPPSNKEVKDWTERTRGSRADLEIRATTGKTLPEWFKAAQKSREVPNKGLGKKTEDFGRYGEKTYSSGNPGGLKKGSGKSVSSMETPERSTRSKIGGAIKKGKQAIRKINNKAGAVKNKAEAKVVAGAKKVAGAVKSANYKAGAVKNKAEEKVLKKIKKK